MGDGNSFPLVCAVVTGNFGWQSIVLCMCSGKYIDIYFIMKITCRTFLIVWVFGFLLPLKDCFLVVSE